MTSIRSLSLLLALFASVNGYSVITPQRASHFVGRSVEGTAAASAGSSNAVRRQSRSEAMTMKKGKANLPPQMRSQYARAQEMESNRQQMMDSQGPGKDGLPVFNLFVRGGIKNMWYPCGSFAGDDKSMALCNNYRDDGFLAGTSKNQLDAGVGSSLFRDLDRLEETIVRGYPQLRKEKGKLEFGYKLQFEGLTKEQTKISIVKVEEQKGFFDGIKGFFGN